MVKNLYNDLFEAPSKVMQTAVTPRDASESIEFYWDSRPQPKDPSPGYIPVMHFSELQLLPDGVVRELYVNINGHLWSRRNYTPRALFSGYIYGNNPTRGYTRYNVSIDATFNTTLPPIINAVEIFTVISTTNVATDLQDVSAMTAIKAKYQVKKNWMGDPCVAQTFVWDGLTCSYSVSGPPRITGVNMSFSGLNGDISYTFANLKAVQFVDLSHNNLTGSIPDALSQLPSLKILNLTENQLSGSIPPGLLKKIQDGSLTLIYADNPNLCGNDGDSCSKAKDKSRVAIYVAVPMAVVALALALLVLFCLLRRNKRGMHSGSVKNPLKPRDETTPTIHVPTADEHDSSLRLENRRFTFKDLKMITNNFQRVIGQGGFGLVYSGFLEDDTQVAVKLRSQSSNQGVKEFLTEPIVPRRGCNPPLIHRDVKATNILLNAKLEAKIADFGLSKAFNGGIDTHVSTNTLVGTPGYVDPEYQATMQPTVKSDVYSFGVVLLELITGKPAILLDLEPASSIIQWTRQRLAQGDIESVVDVRMLSDYYEVNGVWKAAEVALACTARSSALRPTMTDVVAQLQECLALEMGRAAGDDDVMTSSFYTSASSGPSSGYNAHVVTDRSADVNKGSSVGSEMEHRFGMTGPATR